jgi:3-hydroxy-9,10-secoandrosta-1,3,5(10)-triene-9,17-dione monooxygenase
MVGVRLRDQMSELTPQLRDRADEAEQLRRVPDDSIAALTAAGLFRALVPRRYGGDERDLREVYAAVIELAQGCTSTAWVGSLFAFHSFLVAFFEPRAQEELWSAGPDVRIASSVAPMGKAAPVDGGYTLDGRWAFSSGVDHSAWLLLGAVPAGATSSHLFLVPTSAVAIEDDWDVAGLRGTGSKSVIVRGLGVPAHRVLALHAPGLAPGQQLHGPLYRLPWKAVFNSAFPPIAIGTALANLAAFRDYIAGRVNAFSGQAVRLHAGPAIRLAEAAAQVDGAAALLFRDADELAASAASGEPVSASATARIAYNCGFEIDACSRAIHRLWRGSGGKALHRGNAMQRHFRDIFAITQHGAFDPDIQGELYGKALLDDPAFGARR